MRWLRSPALLFAGVLVAAAALLASPEPPRAEATSLPCIGISPAGDVVDGVLGIGNPVGDACEAITDPILGAAGDAVLGPLKEAASSIGKGIFSQVTAWVADGAVWLVGEIAAGMDETTSPNLLSKGFLHQYRLMAQIAALMAALMLIFAVLEALARGELSLLWRVFFVNVPLAAIATSAAYVVVQLLLATSDGMGEAVAQTTSADAHTFFKGAVESLVAVGASTGEAGATAGGGPAGAAAGAVAVPLFVGFIAAVVMAFAALFVWIEMLMRDAAVYVVALFMPLALAAAIWPRWVSALRRTCELLICVIFSKFVIVAVISLAASLVARGDGSVEQLLAAAAMLLIACFAPFVLFKLVPFAEGAISSAYERQSAGGAAIRTLEVASTAQLMRRSALVNWGASGPGGSGGGSASGGAGGGAGGGKPKAPIGGGGSAGGGGGAAGAAEGGAAAGGAAGAAAMPAAAGASAAKAAKGGGEKLAGSGVAAEASSGSGGATGSQSTSDSKSGGAGSSSSPPRPPHGAGESSGTSGSGDPTGPVQGESRVVRPGAGPQPSEPQGGEAPKAGAKPARPSGGDGVAGSASAGGAP